MARTSMRLHNQSSLHSVLNRFPCEHFEPLSAFYLIGLEASGHHMFYTLHPDAYAGSRIAGLSYPSNAYQRTHPNWNQLSDAIKADAEAEAWHMPKYIILLRDPLLQFKSWMRRYWRQSDSISLMYDRWISAASQMQIFVNSLVAMRAPLMVVHYELLAEEPRTFTAAFARFLGTEVGLNEWLSQIHPPERYAIEDVSFFVDCAWDQGRWKLDACNELSFDEAFEKAFYESIISDPYFRQYALLNVFSFNHSYLDASDFLTK